MRLRLLFHRLNLCSHIYAYQGTHSMFSRRWCHLIFQLSKNKAIFLHLWHYYLNQWIKICDLISGSHSVKLGFSGSNNSDGTIYMRKKYIHFLKYCNLYAKLSVFNESCNSFISLPAKYMVLNNSYSIQPALKVPAGKELAPLTITIMRVWDLTCEREMDTGGQEWEKDVGEVDNCGAWTGADTFVVSLLLKWRNEQRK